MPHAAVQDLVTGLELLPRHWALGSAGRSYSGLSTSSVVVLIDFFRPHEILSKNHWHLPQGCAQTQRAKCIYQGPLS